MDLVGLVRYVVNLVVSISTNGRFNNVPDALEAAVIVAVFSGLLIKQLAIYPVAESVSCQALSKQTCQQAVQQAGMMIDQQLAQLGLAWTAMDFDQYSRVYDDDNNLMADELGRWRRPRRTARRELPIDCQPTPRGSLECDSSVSGFRRLTDLQARTSRLNLQAECLDASLA